jgi:hypothetical protein
MNHKQLCPVEEVNPSSLKLDTFCGWLKGWGSRTLFLLGVGPCGCMTILCSSLPKVPLRP